MCLPFVHIVVLQILVASVGRSTDWLGNIVFQSDGVHFHIAVAILHEQFAD